VDRPPVSVKDKDTAIDVVTNVANVTATSTNTITKKSLHHG
jgi:hypothetical protein